VTRCQGSTARHAARPRENDVVPPLPRRAAIAVAEADQLSGRIRRRLDLIERATRDKAPVGDMDGDDVAALDDDLG
jgi:hypothetical protein